MLVLKVHKKEAVVSGKRLAFHHNRKSQPKGVRAGGTRSGRMMWPVGEASRPPPGAASPSRSRSSLEGPGLIWAMVKTPDKDIP